MAKRTLASTVSEWESHFRAFPKQTIKEYQIDWTAIRNNSEGPGVDVSLSTIHNFLKGFRAQWAVESEDTTEIVEPITATVGPAVPAFNLDPLDQTDPVASLIILQAHLGSITIEAEKHLGQCKYISDVLETTLSLLQENQVWSDLNAKTAKLESELSMARSQVESLKVTADTEKELRIQAANKTVYGS